LLAAFISVAGIMPQAPASGKAPYSRHVIALSSAHFPLSGTTTRDPRRPANGAGICYNASMAKQKKTAAKRTKVGGFVVGRARFAKISAVEGIELTELMEQRALEAGRKGLTADEYRRAIVRSYRKG
jgi:hypothetical protein